MSLSDILGGYADLVFFNLIMPIIQGVAFFLNLLMTPVTGLSPIIQVFIVAAMAAGLSRWLARRFKSKRENALKIEFKEKMGSLKYTRNLGDERMEKVLRKGIHEDADKVYEKMLMDKLFDMGISYFFPLFFFLIWLHYDRFSAENLLAVMGQADLFITSSGASFGTGTVYSIIFNVTLVGIWLGEILVKQIRRNDAVS